MTPIEKSEQFTNYMNLRSPKKEVGHISIPSDIETGQVTESAGNLPTNESFIHKSHKNIKIESREKLKNNQGWSKISENEALKMANTSLCWSILHHKTYQLYSGYDEKITIFIMILSTCLVLPQVINDDENKNILRIFSIIMNIIIAALTGYKQIKNYGALSQQHKECSSQFNRIFESIKRELLIYRADRQYAKSFMDYKSQIIDIYKSSAPDIDDSIVKEVKKVFPGISLPDLISDNYDFMVIELPDESITKSSVDLPAGAGSTGAVPATPDRPYTKQITPINISPANLIGKTVSFARPDNIQINNTDASDDEYSDNEPDPPSAKKKIDNTNILNKTNFELARLYQ
jgi:hypothetical protein